MNLILELVVDGGWGDYGEWSECSEECGGGSQTRSRSCDSPSPAHGGADCDGESSETRACNEQNCSGDFLTSNWHFVA